MYIDLANTDHSARALHRLYLTFIQPRPIAFVSTLDEQNRPNLAPFSFYNMMSSNPPIVVFSPALNRNAQPKDTLANIRATNEFVIATVTESIAERMNICSTEFEHGISEFERSGLTPAPAKKVRPFLVLESPVNIECKLQRVIACGDGPAAGQIVVGEIVALHVDDAVLVDGDMVCDPAKLRAVARMGSDLYCRTTDRFALKSLRDPEELGKSGPAKIENDS